MRYVVFGSTSRSMVPSGSIINILKNCLVNRDIPIFAKMAFTFATAKALWKEHSSTMGSYQFSCFPKTSSGISL